jgi:ABC-type polysaccharide/polyol phosphate export permease
MSKKSSAKKIDKAAVAMVGFGVLICGLSVFFHLYWFLIFGAIWIILPVFFTEENHDEDEQD